MRDAQWRHSTPRGVFIGDEETARTVRARARQWVAGLRESWHPLMVFTQSRFRATYRAQSLGIVWPIANPLILMVVMSLVFGVVFRAAMPAYPVFLMLGLVLWHFVIHAWTDGTSSLVRHSAIVKQTAVPAYVVVVGTVLSHLFTLGFASLSLVPLIAFYPEAFRVMPALILLPVLILLALLTTVGLVFATSVLNVRYRDVGYIVDSVLLVLFWATPIVWPIENVPRWMHPVLWINPVASILQCLRTVVMHGAFPPLPLFAEAVASSLGTLVVGVLVYRRYHYQVADHV